MICPKFPACRTGARKGGCWLTRRAETYARNEYVSHVILPDLRLLIGLTAGAVGLGGNARAVDRRHDDWEAVAKN